MGVGVVTSKKCEQEALYYYQTRPREGLEKLIVRNYGFRSYGRYENYLVLLLCHKSVKTEVSCNYADHKRRRNLNR